MIAVLSDPSVGGTFLAWSLHYLAGHKKYYHCKTDQWLDLPANPLNDINAHGFSPNQPSSLETFKLLHSKLLTTFTDQFHTIYFHNFAHTTVSLDTDIITAISNLNTDKIVVLALDKKNHLYQCSHTTRCGPAPSWNYPSQIIDNHCDAFDDFIQYFYKESFELWKQLKLTNVWDQREFFALNLKPYNILSIVPNVDLSRNHYIIDTMELHNTFDVTVDHLFDYLQIKIDRDRKESWNTVYNQWRHLHYSRMLFSCYFERIIDSIILGNNLDLTRFNLDLVQEAAIQHELIYKHNLNLKTWQLEKFTNTKQLHHLLEPNIHDLSKNTTH